MNTDESFTGEGFELMAYNAEQYSSLQEAIASGGLYEIASIEELERDALGGLIGAAACACEMMQHKARPVFILRSWATGDDHCARAVLDAIQ